jgi:2,4-dienoyl-CoA reductase (NADPH2)
MRKSLGDEFILGVRMNAREYMTNAYMTSQGPSKRCLTYEDGRRIAKLLEANGADFIHVSAFGNGIKWEWAHFPEQVLFPDAPEGAEDFKKGVLRGEALIPGSEYFKKEISIPVIGGDGMTFDSAERVLRQGRADLISFARPLIADPDFPNKLREGRVEDIRPCTQCMTCLDAFIRSEHEKCRVNAAFAKEAEMEITPASIKKRVLVVGGGPAGMEAARVTALRGHKVTLVERQAKLGGLMILASLIKGTEVENIPAFINYLTRQMDRLGINVMKGQSVDAALVRKLNPDVVLVASGSKLTVPDIPGIDGKTVTTSSDLHKRVKLPLRFFTPSFLNWATKFWLPIGRRVVLIGGLMQGAEVAEFLVKRGRKVVLTDTSEQLGRGMLEINRTRLLKWLTEKGATLLAGVTYEKITDEGVTLTTNEGKRMILPADTVMVISVPEADHTLYQELKTLVPEVYEIGDCQNPGMIVDAVEAGARIAMTL